GDVEVLYYTNDFTWERVAEDKPADTLADRVFDSPAHSRGGLFIDDYSSVKIAAIVREVSATQDGKAKCINVCVICKQPLGLQPIVFWLLSGKYTCSVQISDRQRRCTRHSGNAI